MCQIKSRPTLLLVFAAVLLLGLYLLRRWLLGFFIAYLALILLIGLIGLVRIIQARMQKKCAKDAAGPKGSGSESLQPTKPVYVSGHTYKRPDPMIYSQSYLMSKGLAVTWDNPDIHLYESGVPVPSNDVLPGQTYTIHSKVWNGSVDAPAVNVIARFYYLSFGIGAGRHYIGQTLIDVPVKGSPKLPTIVEFPWTAPTTPGHYCLQTELVWGDDANPDNNLGQENINVKKLNSPNATFEFVLRNDSVFTKRLLLRADSYSLPPKQCCPEGNQAARPNDIDPYALHRLSRYPVPEGWQIQYTPGDEIVLEPEKEMSIKVKITTTDEFIAKKAININAFDGKQLVGGVTLYVHS